MTGGRSFLRHSLRQHHRVDRLPSVRQCTSGAVFTVDRVISRLGASPGDVSEVSNRWLPGQFGSSPPKSRRSVLPEDSDGLVVTHILELPLDLRPPPGREVTRSSGRRPRREHRVGELGVDPLFVDTSQCPGFDGVGAGRRGFESRADARDDFVLSSRVYRNGRGLSGHPDENWIRETLIKAVA